MRQPLTEESEAWTPAEVASYVGTWIGTAESANEKRALTLALAMSRLVAV